MNRKVRIILGVKQLPGCWAQVDPLWGYKLRHKILSWRKKKHVPKFENNGMFLNHDCYRLIYYDVYNKPGMDLEYEHSPGFIIEQKYIP